jgi:hypothetical protein
MVVFLCDEIPFANDTSDVVVAGLRTADPGREVVRADYAWLGLVRGVVTVDVLAFTQLLTPSESAEIAGRRSRCSMKASEVSSGKNISDLSRLFCV